MDNQSKLVVLPKGDKGQSSYKVLTSEDTVVLCQHRTAHKSLPSGAGFKCNWHVDFSDCSDAEVREMAARTVVIGIRSQFKGDNTPESWEAESGHVIDAADWYRNLRQADNETQKVAKQFGVSISDAQLLIDRAAELKAEAEAKTE